MAAAPVEAVAAVQVVEAAGVEAVVAAAEATPWKNLAATDQSGHANPQSNQSAVQRFLAQAALQPEQRFAQPLGRPSPAAASAA